MNSVPQPGGAVKTALITKNVCRGDRRRIEEIRGIVRVWDRLTLGQGKPLSQRVIESAEQGGFLYEFADGRGEEVYGYYKTADTSQPDYALTVENGYVISCNCPDAGCRKRLCKHQVWLALLTGFSLKLPKGEEFHALAMLNVPAAPSASLVAAALGPGLDTTLWK